MHHFVKINETNESANCRCEEPLASVGDQSMPDVRPARLLTLRQLTTSYGNNLDRLSFPSKIGVRYLYQFSSLVCDSTRVVLSINDIAPLTP